MIKCILTFNATMALLGLTTGTTARADIEIRAGIGGTVSGRINAESAANVSAVPITLTAAFEPQLLGVVIQHQIISYRQGGRTFTGTNLLMGLGAGLDFYKSDPTIFRAEISIYPYGVMTVASDTVSEVNGASYGHSSLTTLQGRGAAEGRVVYLFENNKGQFNKHERLRYGVALGGLFQRFDQKEITVAASNPEIAPRRVTKSSVHQSMILATASFLIAFAF